MADSIPTENSAFLRLPDDVREKIYDYLLPSNQTISATVRFPPIIQACKKTRKEATQNWRSRNTFRMAYNTGPKNFCNGYKHLRNTGLADMAVLRLQEDIEPNRNGCDCVHGCGLTLTVDITGDTYAMQLRWYFHCPRTPVERTEQMAVAKAKGWVGALELILERDLIRKDATSVEDHNGTIKEMADGEILKRKDYGPPGEFANEKLVKRKKVKGEADNKWRWE